MTMADADYAAMRTRQKQKKGLDSIRNVEYPVEKSGDIFHSEKEVILQAYIQSLCLNKKITPQHPLMIPQNLSNHILRLYKDGALNLRIGGV